MLATLSLNAIARVRHALAAFDVEGQLDAIERELRMVEADMADAVVAFERATDDIQRLQALQRVNRAKEWAADIETALAKLMHDSLQR